MNTLIVVAHPEPGSYNAALARVAAATLRAQGHEVRVSDLYAKGFAADEHARHFTQRRDADRFDAQTEQRYSAERGVLPAAVQAEVDDLLWADLLVLQFPLWWFGMPAVLKGWMDRVFVYGKLYSGSRRLHTGVCRGKRAMLSVTAGSSAAACSPQGQEGDTRLILWPVNYSLHYVGFTVLEPAIAYSVHAPFARDDAAAHARFLEEQLGVHAARFMRVDAVPVVPFNTAEDWDEHRQLRPGAPVHSPFIRH